MLAYLVWKIWQAREGSIDKNRSKYTIEILWDCIVKQLAIIGRVVKALHLSLVILTKVSGSNLAEMI